jgi:carbamoyltransferase
VPPGSTAHGFLSEIARRGNGEEMTILGIWDGHDSGAAIVSGSEILFAVNEERLTRRKLEIAFPEKSITTALTYTGLKPRDCSTIAVSTYDFAKTVARVLPYTKEEYYLLRRRKKYPGFLSSLKKFSKYKLTEFGPTPMSGWVSKALLTDRLKSMGFEDFRIHLVDHHLCHAVAAAFCSGFDSCLAVTIDGIGDGLSGTINVFENGTLKRLTSISGRHSLGIFFEHVTNLMNMRELEDEGKVMALANYAYPIEDRHNPLLDFIRVEGLNVRSSYSSLGMYSELKRVLWKYPSEQFAFMAQRTLEVKITELISNALRQTGHAKVALSGGVFSNIKVNMLIRTLPPVEDCFVFPHMGDGGLALGAALAANHDLNRVSSYPLENVYMGPDYSDAEMEDAIRSYGDSSEVYGAIEEKAAHLIADGHIILWFQGRMEYGPRALGGRSILARPDSRKIRDLLNLKLKMRVWYQPFCPTMLEEDAEKYLENYNGKPNRFMTMGYMVEEDKREEIEGVLSIDGSCRPQIVDGTDGRYGRLLAHIRRLTGKGVLLNTSFNIHGEPMVCSPKDAIETLHKTGTDYLVMGDHLVRRKAT